jgi:hypothetical protein
MCSPEEIEETQTAVDWLMRLRQLLHSEGKPLDEALAIANSEFPEG